MLVWLWCIFEQPGGDYGAEENIYINDHLHFITSLLLFGSAVSGHLIITRLLV